MRDYYEDDDEERPRKSKRSGVKKQYWCEACDAPLAHKKEKCPECGHNNGQY